MVMIQVNIKVKDKLRTLKQPLVQGMVALKEVQTTGAEAQANRELQRIQLTPKHSEVTWRISFIRITSCSDIYLMQRFLCMLSRFLMNKTSSKNSGWNQMMHIGKQLPPFKWHHSTKLDLEDTFGSPLLQFAMSSRRRRNHVRKHLRRNQVKKTDTIQR